MKILGIETSGKTFSIALSEDEHIVAEIFWRAGFNHSENLIPSIKWILEKVGWKLGDLNKIAVSKGPGSFTGIRIGLTSARILSEHLGIPLVGADSLEIIRYALKDRGHDVVPAIDALRDEVFVKNIKGEVVIEPVKKYFDKIRKQNKTVIIAGNAALNYRKLLPKNALVPDDSLNYPKAGALCLLALKEKGSTFNKIMPVYIRKSWAEERPLRVKGNG